MARRTLLSFAILLVAAICHAAPRTVVIITLDTTRADRMGFLGSSSKLTPNLDALAQQSIVFTHAYSQVPLTTASHATILTGTYPQFHKVTDAGMGLAKDLPYAPEIFRAHGYRTGAFVGAVILDPKAGGAPGFDRGFDVYDAGFHTRRAGEDRYHSLERRGADVVTHALAWLSKQRGPVFVWIHLYDPHAPYDPPEPFRSRYSSAPYDGEVAYADSVVGRVVDQLRAGELYENAAIAVMADHGEALGEHGEQGHGIFLYDPTIRVPLLLKLPAQRSAGQHVDSPVELVDVLPTLLQVSGIPANKGIQGESLLPRLAAKNPADRPAYSETEYPQHAYGWSSLRALRSGKYLFVEAPRNELYDQGNDPQEINDLATRAPAVANTLRTELEQLRQRTSSSRPTAKAALDPEQEAKLRALGYTAGTRAGSDAKPSGVDPKDKIAIANQMTDANLAMEEGRTSQAIAILQNVIGQDAACAPAYTQLGGIWAEQGDLKRAIPALREAVKLRPESVSAQYSLATALFDAGDLQGSVPNFEAAVAGNPGSADMRYSLASVYVRINRFAEAKKQLMQALEIKPASFDANLMLGQIYVVEKNPAAALPYLQKAAKSQPKQPQPHHLLAEAYAQLGRRADAARERALAEAPMKP